MEDSTHAGGSRSPFGGGSATFGAFVRSLWVPPSAPGPALYPTSLPKTRPNDPRSVLGSKSASPANFAV